MKPALREINEMVQLTIFYLQIFDLFINMKYILFGYICSILFHLALNIKKQGLAMSLHEKGNYFLNNAITFNPYGFWVLVCFNFYSEPNGTLVTKDFESIALSVLGYWRFPRRFGLPRIIRMEKIYFHLRKH